MTDKRTQLEIECDELLTNVMEYLTVHTHPPKYIYMEILGHVRDTLKHLLNKKFGCMTGKHAGTCACQEQRGFLK